MAGRRGDAHAAVRAGRWCARGPRVVAISAPLNACRVHGRWPRGGPGQHPTLPAASPLGKPPTRGPVAPHRRCVCSGAAGPDSSHATREGASWARTGAGKGGACARGIRSGHAEGRSGYAAVGGGAWPRGGGGGSPAWPGLGVAAKGRSTRPHVRARGRSQAPRSAVSVAGREGKRPAPGSRRCTRDRFLHRLLHEGRLRAPRKRPPVGLFLGGSRKWTSGGSGGRASPALSAQTPTVSPPLAPVALPHGEAR